MTISFARQSNATFGYFYKNNKIVLATEKTTLYMKTLDWFSRFC